MRENRILSTKIETVLKNEDEYLIATKEEKDVLDIEKETWKEAILEVLQYMYDNIEVWRKDHTKLDLELCGLINKIKNL